MASKGLLGSHQKRSMTVAILVFMIHLAGVAAYGDGAPRRACEDMTPGHGSESTGTPYTLKILDGATLYSGMSTVRVKLRGGGSFAGLLLQARRKDNNTPVGTFTEVVDGTKTRRCTVNDDAVTHSNSEDKDSGAIFTWQAPNEDVGEVEFVATVAQAKNTWWLNHKSGSLSPIGFNADNATPTTSISTIAGLLCMLILLLRIMYR